MPRSITPQEVQRPALPNQCPAAGQRLGSTFRADPHFLPAPVDAAAAAGRARLLVAESEAVQLFSAAVRAAGGSVAVSDRYAVDTSDLDKMTKLDKAGRAQRQPQLRIALALLQDDQAAREAFHPVLVAAGARRAPRLTRQQVLEALGAALLSMPDLLRLLLPQLQRELGAADAAAVMAPLATGEAA